MAKARKFSELTKDWTEERKAKVEERVQRTLAAMPLAELRIARLFTQKALARTLELDQGSISRLEHRTDMYISTLKSYIEAMGGELDIRAKFPDGEVRITQFAEEGEKRELPAQTN